MVSIPGRPYVEPYARFAILIRDSASDDTKRHKPYIYIFGDGTSFDFDRLCESPHVFYVVLWEKQSLFRSQGVGARVDALENKVSATISQCRKSEATCVSGAAQRHARVREWIA